MIKYAITGNIASGKSQVEKMLKDFGYIVFDTDIIAHNILENSKELIETFKDYDILENDKISREKLGKLVFADNELRKKLESIIHPKIKSRIKEIFEQYKNEEKVFISIPLLFEANMEDLFDKIIFIYANDEIRLQRLMKRNNFSKEEALLRINAQMTQQEKIKFCDCIVNNETTIEDLKIQILKILGL